MDEKWYQEQNNTNLDPTDLSNYPENEVVSAFTS